MRRLGGATRKLYLASVCLLAAVTVLAVALNTLQYRNRLIEAAVNAEYVGVLSLIDKTDYAVSLGKPIDNFYGMDYMLRAQCDLLPNLHNLHILSPEGKTLFHAYPVETPLPQGVAAGDYRLTGNRFCFFAPLVGGASLVVEGSIATLLPMTLHYLLRIAIVCALLASGIALLLYLALGVVDRRGEAGRALGQRLCIASLVMAQLFVGGVAYYDSITQYQSSLAPLTASIAQSVATDITSLTNRGIPMEEFVEFEEYLASYTAKLPIFSRITLIQRSDSALRGELYADLSAGGQELTLRFSVSPTEQRKTLMGYLLSTGLLLVTSLLLTTEIQLLTLRQNKRVAGDNTPGDNAAAMRLLIFFLYACVNTGLALVPMAASQLYSPDSGLSRSFAVSLPITTEMVAGLVAILLSGYIIGRRGLARTLGLAIACCCGGLAVCAFSYSILPFALGRAAVGFGYGLITLSGRTFASCQPNAAARTTSLAALSGGSIAGLCFGSTIGGLLADQTSFRVVFLLASVAVLLALSQLGKIHFTRPLPGGGGRVQLSCLLGSSTSLLYLLLLVGPVNFCGVFISYLMPLFANQQQLSATAVSALIMVNSLTAGYLSPAMTSLCMKRLPLKAGVLLYPVLTAGAIGIFALLPTLPSMAIAVLLLGLADSFGLVMLIEGFGRTPGAARCDASLNMSVFTIVGKAGQAVAPGILSLAPGFGVAGAILALTAGGGAALYLAFDRLHRGSP